MEKFRISALAFVTLSIGATSSLPAQMPTVAPGAPDASRVSGGQYKLDPAHTQVSFTVNHLGFSLYRGIFGDVEGTMTLDPKAPARSRLAVDIPIAKVVTTSTALNEHLMKPEFFDGAKFPTAHFESTAIVAKGTAATITGNLTLKGVTRPVVLKAHFIGAGKGPMNGKENVGFEATTSIKRSDFGVSYGVPLVPDEVPLQISAAFEKID